MPKQIKPTGPCPSNFMLIAERPGIVEARMGRVLCGPSGQELDRYLLNNSLIPRDKVYCTNVVKDYRDDENPEEYEVQRDWPLVVEEVERVRPRYIGLMGLWAARAFLGAEIELEWAHGLAFPLKWEMGEFWVMPLIHTAAALHHLPTMGRIAWDFEQFGKMCRGEKMPMGHLRDGYPEPFYREVKVGGVVPLLAGVDTEGSVAHPWCLSYSVEPGSGGVFRHSEVEFDEAVLHSALHDLPVLATMGVRPQKWTDTLLMAALLGVEPQGLKPLARRHCGMKMQEYSDIVAPAKREKALQYLAEVLDWLQTNAQRSDSENGECQSPIPTEPRQKKHRKSAGNGTGLGINGTEQPTKTGSTKLPGTVTETEDSAQ